MESYVHEAMDVALVRVTLCSDLASARSFCQFSMAFCFIFCELWWRSCGRKSLSSSTVSSHPWNDVLAPIISRKTAFAFSATTFCLYLSKWTRSSHELRVTRVDGVGDAHRAGEFLVVWLEAAHAYELGQHLLRGLALKHLVV